MKRRRKKSLALTAAYLWVHSSTLIWNGSVSSVVMNMLHEIGSGLVLDNPTRVYHLIMVRLSGQKSCLARRLLDESQDILEGQLYPSCL